MVATANGTTTATIPPPTTHRRATRSRPPLAPNDGRPVACVGDRGHTHPAPPTHWHGPATPLDPHPAGRHRDNCVGRRRNPARVDQLSPCGHPRDLRLRPG